MNKLYLFGFIILLLFFLNCSQKEELVAKNNMQAGREEGDVMEKTVAPVRCSPKEVHGRVTAGDALLVCAYDSDDKFQKVKLEPAISYSAFKQMVPTLAKDSEIVFYCA